MNIETFAYELTPLSPERQKQGLKAIFDYLLEDIENNLIVIDQILEVCSDYEADDGFGTEGLEV